MRATRLWPVAAVALAGVLLVSAPSGQTQAQWRESATTTISGPSSDVFEMSATASGPQVDLTNLSRRQSADLDVRSTRVTRVDAGDTNDLLARAALVYTSGQGACGGTTQSTYWAARSAGQITAGTTYTRPQGAVAGATLAPGAGRVLCPTLSLPYPATAAGERDTYLAHAGRSVDITTVVRQTSKPPATWASTERTTTTRFSVGTPAPTSPAGTSPCRSEASGGQGSGSVGRLAFGWPLASTSTTTPTPAMAGGWEVLVRPVSGSWKSLATLDASARLSNPLLGSKLGPVGSTYELVLRGYPFAGDHARYVESDWLVRATNDSAGRNDRFVCTGVIPNPDQGQVNLP